MRKKIITLVLSIIFTLCIVIGISFIKEESLSLITNHIFISTLLFILLSVIFYVLLDKTINIIDKLDISKKQPKSKIGKLFTAHPFICSFITLILFWLPYLIAYYPGFLNYDASYQILQYFGIDNKYSDYSVLLDENVIITNHHPVVHTLLLGLCTQIGMNLINFNFGVFIYTAIQYIILALTLSYTISFLNKEKAPYKYLLVLLAIYALVPIFPRYAITVVKDVIFTCLVVIYIIQMYKLLKKEEKISLKHILLIIILLTLIMLFRNNGIYVIILSFIFLIFLNKPNRLRYLFIYISIILITLLYNNVVLPYFKITPSSIREALSIPFQQTARYVSVYSEEVTEEEKEAIDKVLTYDTLEERYNPEKSDPVKNEYNKYTTDEELKEYFKVWFKQFTCHPLVYIEATINNTYGYFCPLKTNWYVYYKYNQTVNKYGFDYHRNNLESLRNVLDKYAEAFPYIPIIGLIVNIGFNTWLLLFMVGYLIYKKRYKYLTILSPSLVVLLVCIASPVNTYFRYAMPYVFAMPIVIYIIFKITREK